MKLQRFCIAALLLSSDPEVMVMDPTKRSRLRWYPAWQ